MSPPVVIGTRRGAGRLIIERAKMPMTFNVARQSSLVWRIRKELADWREWSAGVAEASGWEPLIGPVAVTAEHQRKHRGSMPDTGAPILAVKAMIDGLVDAGVLPGDGPDVVRRLIFEAPSVVGYHGLRVTVTEIDEVAWGLGARAVEDRETVP